MATLLILGAIYALYKVLSKKMEVLSKKEHHGPQVFEEDKKGNIREVNVNYPEVMDKAKESARKNLVRLADYIKEKAQ